MLSEIAGNGRSDEWWMEREGKSSSMKEMERCVSERDFRWCW
jgi:hypothetical protein